MAELEDVERFLAEATEEGATFDTEPAPDLELIAVNSVWAFQHPLDGVDPGIAPGGAGFVSYGAIGRARQPCFESAHFGHSLRALSSDHLGAAFDRHSLTRPFPTFTAK